MTGPLSGLSGTKLVAGAAVFTAFVAAATSLFAVILPLGYFNIGEIMVYTSALLMGPYVGAFAGGVGSAISDVSLGYPQYAPGTLVIKGVEGFIVGYLSSVAFKDVSRGRWRAATVLIGLVFASFLAFVGTSYLTGQNSVTLGGAWYLPVFTLAVDVPAAFWAGIAAVAFIVIVAAGFMTQETFGWQILSVLVGGMEMVAGYFLYETFVLQLGSYPPTEVPFNVAQALIGLLVSVPLVRSIRRVSGTRQVSRGAAGATPQMGPG